MKRFMLLHYGFEKPTQEVMEAWGRWFERLGDRSVENGGFHGPAREIAKGGEEDLGRDHLSITGYSIIDAADFEEATALARENPFITSIRVYEITNG